MDRKRCSSNDCSRSSKRIKREPEKQVLNGECEFGLSNPAKAALPNRNENIDYHTNHDEAIGSPLYPNEEHSSVDTSVPKRTTLMQLRKLRSEYAGKSWNRFDLQNLSQPVPTNALGQAVLKGTTIQGRSSWLSKLKKRRKLRSNFNKNPLHVGFLKHSTKELKEFKKAKS